MKDVKLKAVGEGLKPVACRWGLQPAAPQHLQGRKRGCYSLVKVKFRQFSGEEVYKGDLTLIR